MRLKRVEDVGNKTTASGARVLLPAPTSQMERFLSSTAALKILIAAVADPRAVRVYACGLRARSSVK